MTDTPWFLQKRHYRDLRDALINEGFTILKVWKGRHLRLRVSLGPAETTITLACSPRCPEHAIDNSLKQARKGIKCKIA